MLDRRELSEPRDAILVQRLTLVMERTIGDDPKGSALTGWLQHKVYCGTAVGSTEGFGDLFPLEDLTKPGLQITIQLLIEILQKVEL